MKKFLGKKYLIFAGIVIVLLLLVRFYSAFQGGAVSVEDSTSVTGNKSLPNFTAAELKKYDGTDKNLPIYLALDGNVYDVTKGKKFYMPGGPYHYLAGKDSSFELHIVGGDIIKRKYPIIGRYENTN